MLFSSMKAEYISDLNHVSMDTMAAGRKNRDNQLLVS